MFAGALAQSVDDLRDGIAPYPEGSGAVLSMA